MGHPLVQAQQIVQFIGRQKVPIAHLAAQVGDFGMIGHQLRFGVGGEAAVDAANALHQPHRVPVQIVVDQQRRVLQIQAFR